MGIRSILILLSALFLTIGCVSSGEDSGSGSKTAAVALPNGMIKIPAGTFTMGNHDPAYTSTRERPLHDVTIDSFYINEAEVTAAEYKACVDAGACTYEVDPAKEHQTFGVGGKENHPISYVSWDDAQSYIAWLNSANKGVYRLCSESEWEYAARAGTTTMFPCGDDPACLNDIAWYKDNSGGSTNPVKQKQPNAWGLYDVIGNLYEWVQDTGHDDYVGAPADGSAWEANGNGERVCRGNYWDNSASSSRVSKRYDRADSGWSSGMRVCADSIPAEAPVVSKTTPADGASNIPGTTSIAVTFDQSMTVASVDTKLSDATNDTCTGTLQVSNDDFATCLKMAAAPVASHLDTTFTVTPVTALTIGTTYKIRATTAATSFPSDPSSDGIKMESEYTSETGFTIDNTAPVVSAISPVDGKTAPLNTTIVVTFDEAIDSNTMTTNTADTSCSGTIQLSEDGFNTCLQMSAVPVASNDGKTFTVTPAALLTEDASHDIKVNASGLGTPIADVSGNPMTTEFTSSFFAFDPIIVASTVPADKATNIALNSDISVTFNVAMDPTTITANASDDACSGTIQVTGFGFINCLKMKAAPVASNGNMTYTVTPDAELEFGKVYKVRVLTDAKDPSGKVLEYEYNSTVGFEARAMVEITGGQFKMGDPSTDALAPTHKERETPAHDVTVDTFYISDHEVTAAEYKACVDEGTCPAPTIHDSNYASYGKAGKENHPMTYLYWGNAKSFMTWMNANSSVDYTYRLCTEAEWEYAARAGSTTYYVCGEGNEETCLDSIAWHKGNSGSESHEIRTKSANAWGLYDMYGSATEFVEDHYHDGYAGAPIDGASWVDPTSDERVYRGGWAGSEYQDLRASYRWKRTTSSRGYSTGLRVCGDKVTP